MAGLLNHNHKKMPLFPEEHKWKSLNKLKEKILFLILNE